MVASLPVISWSRLCVCALTRRCIYLPCVRQVDLWRDERMWELAQNAGALWVHELLKRHRLRVLDPEQVVVGGGVVRALLFMCATVTVAHSLEEEKKVAAACRVCCIIRNACVQSRGRLQGCAHG